MLDVCSYVGAWAVTALKARRGQRHLRRLLGHRAGVTSTAQCARQRRAASRRCSDDAFDALKALQEQGERYDVVILDPPAFVKRKKDLPQAQAAYRKLNQLALQLIERDGLLVSCSCSYHLARRGARGRHPGRGAAHQPVRADPGGGGQSPDHPVHPAIPETRYLKAFFCRVTRE